MAIPMEEDNELRRGPWTLEEDTLLIHYITRHGEGRWNLLAKSAGLKRTGKSCRLRWLNYLKPDIKRGNLTPQEQFLILELHSKWGNRWSKIAQHLPGRTDNEIKNYWRTRVQKQARQLNVHDSSKGFVEAVRCFWMPRLRQKVEQTCSFKGMSSQGCIDPALSTIKIPGNANHSSENFSSVTCPTSFINISEQTEQTSPSKYGHTQINNEACNTGRSGYDMEGFGLESMSTVGFYEEINWISDDALWNIDEMMFRELEEIGINSII